MVRAQAAVEVAVAPLTRSELGRADDAFEGEPGFFQCTLLGDVLGVRGSLDSLNGRVLEQVGAEDRLCAPANAPAARLWQQRDADLPAERLGAVVPPPASVTGRSLISDR